jgi:Fur family transcriptional regulator, ferric uptake regulator
MKFKQLLKNKELKSTKARIEILKLIFNQSKPSDINQIHEDLSNQGFKFNLATVYRVLEKFNQVNLVNQVDFREGKLRYEIAGDHHHHHLVCKKCKSVEDIYGECLQKVEALISKKYKFVAVEHALEFFGVCQTCQETHE